MTNINPEMIMLLGDSHGNFGFMHRAIEHAAANDTPVVHVLGDFGIWTHTGKGEAFLQRTSETAVEYDVTVTFNDGNHENFDALERWPVLDSGWRKVRERIWHAPRGHMWTWGQTKFLSMGGANSIDGPKGAKWWHDRFGQSRGIVPKGHPVSTHRGVQMAPMDMNLGHWWEQEEITDKDVERALAQIAANGRPDVMLCHDVPTVVDIKQIMGKNDYPGGRPNRERLTEVYNAARPTILAHGHYHTSYVHDDGDTTFIGLDQDMGEGTQFVFMLTDPAPVLLLPRALKEGA